MDVLGGREQAGKGQHLVFVNDAAEQRQRDYKSIVEGGLGQRKTLEPEDDNQDGDMENDDQIGKPKSRLRAGKEALAAKEGRFLRKKHKKERDARKIKLATLKARERDLRDAENELEVQRAKMSNSIGGITKGGVKWKVRERKS